MDKVVASVDEDQTVAKTLELIKPDIFAKGGDHFGPEHIPEAEICNKIGCKLVTNVGGNKVITHSDVSTRVKHLGLEDSSCVRVTCDYCGDHPILREKCQVCKGTGKIPVGKS